MENYDIELKKIIDKYELAGLTVIHTNKDNIDYHQTFGYQDIEKNIPTSKNTIYRIASISKVIVAIGIMKLVEDGVLDIYEDISKYLGFKFRNPNFPDKVITLEMLMTQTSSLHDGDDDGDIGYCASLSTDEELDLEDFLYNPSNPYYLKETFSEHVPGSYWHYANLGCCTLAAIIERVTGKLFVDYIKEILLDPLNLDAGFRISQITKTNEVATLYNYNNQLIKSRDYESFVRGAYPIYQIGNNYRGVAGGLQIGGIDLSIIMRMMMNKGIFNGVRILKEETINEMEKVHWSGWSEDPEYKAKGLQLNLMDGYSKETLKGHFGCAYGLRSFMLYNNNNGYIFLCNGANYHERDGITELQEDVLKYLINKFEK